MLMPAGDVSEATPTPVTRIAITGPPVKVVKPVVSVFEVSVFPLIPGPWSSDDPLPIVNSLQKDGRDSRPDARVVGVKQVLSKFLLQVIYWNPCSLLRWKYEVFIIIIIIIIIVCLLQVPVDFVRGENAIFYIIALSRTNQRAITPFCTDTGAKSVIAEAYT